MHGQDVLLHIRVTDSCPPKHIERPSAICVRSLSPVSHVICFQEGKASPQRSQLQAALKQEFLNDAPNLGDQWLYVAPFCDEEPVVR